MKKTVFLFFMICPFYVLLSQTIKGTVVNDIDKPIANVSIYLDGTKTGTTSAADGSFSITSNHNNSLVFQKDDYETFTVNTSEVLNKKLKVVLIKAKEIEEVVIIPFTEATYRNYINFFLDSFIGYDKENVRIKNQRTLKFSYDKTNKVLRVKAPQTLIIENKNLGYIIDYNLQDFVADFENKTTRYIGTSFFKETKSTVKVKLNRMNAYDGSQVHFFRSVFANKVADEGFIVNQITKFPNSKYPTEEELQRLKDFAEMFKSKGTLNVPEDILDIGNRKRSEQPYKIAITKTQIPETDYTKKTDNKLYLDYNHMMQINFKKYFYELKKGQFVKATTPIVQTSFLHPENDTFEIYTNGNTSNPGMLTNQGEFTKNKIEFLLPLDYELGN
ncbi:carboxypeptidase-like regulatory domain-containing protein [Chryseobacterium sp. CFBP8996]|uniref:carboxypeptidase-like regulatory domain-containing protein n=1 Tax=Chryseobacterium sp. CFBP8996 TaxID=3096529 RepID=UPI002A6ABFBB|nr:carboxypeptidase-like regulatory domain-containing protein [Chryseobacterium sp. CFBP8996]MDY0930998.1 carboxypeptidase-like regulatory domain-containing protein [Chryseobacterium sp. CFBP8996]